MLEGRFVTKDKTFAIVTYQFMAATIVGIIAFFIMSNEPVIISTKAWISLFYLGLIGTLFCYFVTVWIMNYVSALKVVIIFSLEPVFAAIFGYFILTEVLNLRELAGAGFILFGVIVHSILKNK